MVRGYTFTYPTAPKFLHQGRVCKKQFYYEQQFLRYNCVLLRTSVSGIKMAHVMFHSKIRVRENKNAVLISPSIQIYTCKNILSIHTHSRLCRYDYDSTRSLWRKTIHTSTEEFEVDRLKSLDLKPQDLKKRTKPSYTQGQLCCIR